MKLTDRYIFLTVSGTVLVALLVMLSLDIFFNVLREVDNIGEGSYGVFSMLLYMLMTLPRRIYETLPMALLVGGLLGMGGLAASSELIVMRAAGLSILRLVIAAMKAGLVLSLVALLLGEYISPTTERWAKQMRADAREKQVSIGKGRGFWARDGNLFINVRGIKAGFQLVNIYIYEVDAKANLISVTWARSAKYLEEQRRWELDGVSRSFIDPDAVTTETGLTIAWDSVIRPEMLQVLASSPEHLSMRDLMTFIDYLELNSLDAKNYELVFWSKVVAPLTNLAMLFIAMPFVFGPQRKAGAGQRLLIGILLGLLFYLANRMVSNMVLLYGFHPLLGASLPTLVFIAAGAYALSLMR